jgi:uncharacterized Zn-finger protein
MLGATAMTTDCFVPEVRYVETPRVSCDGDEGPLGHPRVWMQIDDKGYVYCGYCDRRFILGGGPADMRR